MEENQNQILNQKKTSYIQKNKNKKRIIHLNKSFRIAKIFNNILQESRQVFGFYPPIDALFPHQMKQFA